MSPSISRLRASGVVNRDTKSVLISFGGGDDALRREILVQHRGFPNGGSWSFLRARCATVGLCVGGVVRPMGLAIAAREGQRSSAMPSVWHGSGDCANSSTAVRRDCTRGEVARWIDGASSRFR
jgi:hypothetical protein